MMTEKVLDYIHWAEVCGIEPLKLHVSSETFRALKMENLTVDHYRTPPWDPVHCFAGLPMVIDDDIEAYKIEAKGYRKLL